MRISACAETIRNIVKQKTHTATSLELADFNDCILISKITANIFDLNLIKMQLKC